MIDGVVITPLKRITDDRGSVMHMLRNDAPHFAGFGEIYFSGVNPGAVKAWKRHTRMTMNLAVPVGRIKLVLFDDRPDSPTLNEIQDVILGPDEYQLVTIPPMIWNGFQSIGDIPSVVANCATVAHDPNEAETLAADDPAIPHRWT